MFAEKQKQTKEQTKEPGCISSNFLFKNSYSNDHCQFVPAKDFSKADSEMFNYTHALRILHAVTILRLNHSKGFPTEDPLEG